MKVGPIKIDDIIVIMENIASGLVFSIVDWYWQNYRNVQNLRPNPPKD